MEPTPHLKSPYWKSTQKVANYAITGQDSQSGFNNLNAAINITLTLPKAVVGGAVLQYKFLVSTAHTITITPKVVTDTIRGFPTGASVTLTGIGSGLHLECWTTGFWEIVTEVSAIGGQFYNPTPAELAAGVTPVNLAIPPLPIDPRRYGGDNTGATFSDAAWASAIAVARKTVASPRGAAPIYVNGTYKVASLNFASQGSIDFNRGFTLFGDGIDSSIINILPGVANTGIGLDMGCAAYFCVRDILFNFGSSAANCPKVGLLLAKGNYSGLIFSGIGMFQRCIFNAWGTYGVYDYCAEQIDFNNCQFLGLTANTIPVTLSRVNTAGITSPNFVIETANDSMTEISFSGSESTISWSGNGVAVPGLFLDIGTSTGIAGIDLGTTYFPATGATSIAIADNGGAGSALQSITASNMISEQNAGSGTQQVMVSSAATVKGINIRGYSASGVAQTATEFVFGNVLRSSNINWNGNVVNSVGGTPIIVQASAAVGCILQVTGNAAQAVSIGMNQQSLIVAGDGITGTFGTFTFTGGIGINGVPAPAQVIGWGVPTGSSVVANFPGATATLAQTSGVVAEIILALKQLGLFGA